MSRQRRALRNKKGEQSSASRRESKSARPSKAAAARPTPANLPPEILEAGNAAVGRLLSGLSGGSPLDHSVQEEMEQAFGTDFSEVRIHDDQAAHARAGEIDAEAFTHGDDIYIAEEVPSPATAEGKRLLAHELAHVVQHRRAGGQKSRAVGKPGNRFETEADQAAISVGAGRAAEVSATGAPPSVQRQPAEGSLVDKALDYILKEGISYTSDGWKIGGVPIEKVPEAAKTSADVLAKILKGDLAGAVEVVSPKDPEEEKKAWEKVRKIKAEIDALRPPEDVKREEEEKRRAEEEAYAKVIRESSEKLKLKPRDPTFELKVPELGSSLRMGMITHYLLDDFDHKKSQLKSKHRKKLNELAAQVMADPDAQLDIVGHTDSTGTDEFNQELSEKRANVVRDYLIERGVNPSKIKSVTGKAAQEPWAVEKVEADRAANRRVEIYYIPGVGKEKKRGFGLPPLSFKESLNIKE